MEELMKKKPHKTQRLEDSKYVKDEKKDGEDEWEEDDEDEWEDCYFNF